MQYAYDEVRAKSVTVIDTAKRSVESVPLESGKKLTETDADNFDECLQKLDFFKDDYVRLKYGGEPLSRDETAEIKSHPAFNDLVVTATVRGAAETVRRAHLGEGEIFDMYYKSRYNETPSAELKAAFIELMEELKSEAR